MKTLTIVFLIAAFSISFCHLFSPPALMFGSVTQLLQRTENSQPANKMVTAWRACSLPWQSYERQFEDAQSHMKNSVYPRHDLSIYY